MSYSLHSSDGFILGIIQGTPMGNIKRDTRNLDYASYEQPYLFM